jgi:2-oxo-4-hydroxy-4-carboxy-5-ureidoimidazoline decarboxylase
MLAPGPPRPGERAVPGRPGSVTAVDLAEFDALPGEAAERALLELTGAPRFAREVAAGRPYGSVGALADRAEKVVRGLGWAEVEQALAGHPRIGDRTTGRSAAEQAAVTAAPDTHERLRLANQAYEARFGHVFLIRAAGRGPAEILTELDRRLGNDPAAERAETTGQLAEITRLRVEGLVSG